ncbi:MAG: hypothetical protein ACYCS7_16805 [Acidimicrobiales bacterium]
MIDPHADDPDDIDTISIPIDQVPAPPAPPRVDEDSRLLLDRLLTTATDLRFPLSRYDAAAELHVLASLQADIHTRLPGVIAEARDQDYIWNQIAASLSVSPAAARHRFQQRQPPTDRDRRTRSFLRPQAEIRNDPS